ncbi:SMI1/KNR4 family protein [Paenibacillus ehimensis]|uniref:SMI1/KNR4 family protein n=1 Tax=Paenibacillus ehimensis TaxID=79264 RepID=UPI0004709C4C|nr:SMI1/KNR4 family protein [Paenibacillus ehimensis]
MNKIIYLTLKSLKARLAKQPILWVQRELGYVKPCTCAFYKAATPDQIYSFVKETSFFLPTSYIDFLKMHDGAILFQDQSEYVNPPWYIFGLEEIMEYSEQNELPPNLYAIAKYDQIIIFIDSSRVKEGREDYLFEGATIGHEYEAINLNFELWFERLIVCQGAFFWYWNTYSLKDYQPEEISLDELNEMEE